VAFVGSPVGPWVVAAVVVLAVVLIISGATEHLEFALRMKPDAGPEHRWTDVQEIARTITV
jgi:hypothetical protein